MNFNPSEIELSNPLRHLHQLIPQPENIIQRLDLIPHELLVLIGDIHKLLLPVKIEPADGLPVVIVKQDGAIRLGIS